MFLNAVVIQLMLRFWYLAEDLSLDRELNSHEKVPVTCVLMLKVCCCHLYFFQSHLYCGEHLSWTLPPLQLEESPLQEHLIGSWHALHSSGIVNQAR